MFVSVIVPAFNEERFIVGCLESVGSVMDEADLKYEIIVVDNGSTDGTAELLSEMHGITTLRIARTSVAEARNIGTKNAQGSVFAFLDADVVVKKSWAEGLKRLSEKAESLFVTGYQYGVRDNSSWVEKYWFGDMEFDHISGGNLIVSRDAFLALEGFDPTLKTGEDVNFCNRARKDKSIEFFIDPVFESVHLGYPRDLSQFVKRELWHGEGDFRSLSDFLSSKIAIISVVYGLMSFLGLGCLVFGEWLAGAAVLVVTLSLNYAISGFRFGHWLGRACVFKNVINFVYFIARFFSFFRAFKNRNLSY